MESEPEKSVLDFLRENLANYRNWFKRPMPDQKSTELEADPPAGAAAKVPEPLVESDVEAQQAPISEASEIQTPVEIQSAAGMARVTITVELPLGTLLILTIHAEADGKTSVDKQYRLTPPSARPILQPYPSGLRLRLEKLLAPVNVIAGQPERVLLTAAIVIYLFVIGSRLADFPIYFFGDEAIQAVFAERLINNNWISVNADGIPIYVEAAGNRWTPLISMYIHAIAIELFGKSIFVTRFTTGLIGMLGAISVSLILKKIFNRPIWWSGMLIMLSMPAWFLHTRTAFETVISTGFYGLFLLFYLLYRTHSPKYLFGAIIFGAAVFYSYSNSQAVLLVLAGLLFLSDVHYHWENRKTVLQGLVLLLVMAIPFIIFRINEPDAIATHLRAVNSYLVQDIPLSTKIQTFTEKYLYGLSPQYWTLANTKDLIRHRMLGFAQISGWAYLLMLAGVVIALRRVREPAYRAVLLAALATPVGAATLDVSITRVLSFVVPASILAGLGLSWVREKIPAHIPRWIFDIGTLLILSLISLRLLNIALTQGPLWASDYGLYGLQYGAKQIFRDTIPEYLAGDPDNGIYISSTWANGTDIFISYFVAPQERSRVQMFGIENALQEKVQFGPKHYFILTTPEYQKAVDSNFFKEIRVDKIINYPNDQPGFYIVQLTYADNIDQIFAAQEEALNRPVEGEVTIDGQLAKVIYSRIDAGQLKDMFDSDFFTLMRGAEANPFLLDIIFPEARTLSKFIGDFSMMDFTITFTLYPPGNGAPVTYEASQRNVTIDAHVEVIFDRGPAQVQRIRLEIKNLLVVDKANIHLREIQFLP
ncbi:MAG: glycosyltransferase family 39 protein [Anaerolineae bacterium]|nr:glycosyltransferase family 39 protein [Anaerolineae bacterium]MCI0608310.1 glycosyltransferase family 39 protein [Anaerolineae bacterium]